MGKHSCLTLPHIQTCVSKTLGVTEWGQVGSYTCSGFHHSCSSTLAWKIPWAEEPGRLQSMGLQRVGERLRFHFSLSCIGEGNGNLLQYSCLENPRDMGAWWAAICRVAQSWTQLKRLSSSSKGLRAKDQHILLEQVKELIWTKTKHIMDFNFGTSLVVQWLRLWAFTTKGKGSIPGWETKIPHSAWPKIK